MIETDVGLRALKYTSSHVLNEGCSLFVRHWFLKDGFITGIHMPFSPFLRRCSGLCTSSYLWTEGSKIPNRFQLKNHLEKMKRTICVRLVPYLVVY